MGTPRRRQEQAVLRGANPLAGIPGEIAEESVLRGKSVIILKYGFRGKFAER